MAALPVRSGLIRSVSDSTLEQLASEHKLSLTNIRTAITDMAIADKTCAEHVVDSFVFVRSGEIRARVKSHDCVHLAGDSWRAERWPVEHPHMQRLRFARRLHIRIEDQNHLELILAYLPPLAGFYHLETLIISHVCRADFAAAAPLGWPDHILGLEKAFAAGARLKKIKIMLQPVLYDRPINQQSRATLETLVAVITQANQDKLTNGYLKLINNVPKAQ